MELKCKINGLDELIDEMTARQDEIGDLFEEMLEAGAEEVKQCWRDAVDQHGHKLTGQMYDAIDYTIKPETPDGIKRAFIYPQGSQTETVIPDPYKTNAWRWVKRSKPIRRAEIAFIIHYGTEKVAGSHFVNTVDNLVEVRVPEKLIPMWEQWLEGKRR